MSKAILVTGASRGIGRAAARLAGQRGWAVGLNYAGNADAARAAAAEVEAEGGRALAIQDDVSVEADVIAMFDAAQNAFGALDGSLTTRACSVLPCRSPTWTLLG